MCFNWTKSSELKEMKWIIDLKEICGDKNLAKFALLLQLYVADENKAVITCSKLSLCYYLFPNKLY